jgi:predicted metal-dependent peptidase
MACDYAINPLVIDAGLALPKDVLIDNRFRGMSAERIYNLIEEEDDGGGGQQQDDQQRSSENNPDGRGGDEDEPNAPKTPGGFGQVLDAPEGSEADGKDADEQARDWQIAVEQAETISKLAGKLPAGLERSLQGAEEARVDWRELLRRAWSETTPSDYSWMRPNRRHIWQGLYLPGVQREGVGEVVIFVGCSGSIYARQLSVFEAEVRSILEGQRPERVYVVYFDAHVNKVEVYEAGRPIQLAPVGGGGTDFRPCFQWVEESHVQPQILVFLTDLYGTLPDQPPPHPVLWASTGSQRAPFGQVVPLQAA